MSTTNLNTNLTNLHTNTRIEIEDPYMSLIATRILNTMKLASQKAIAHNVNPESFKISKGPKSFEQIMLSYARLRSRSKQEEAGKKALNHISLPLSEREKDFGELAKVDLHSSTAIEEQVHALSIPANFKWPLGHEKTLHLINNRVKSIPSARKITEPVVNVILDAHRSDSSANFEGLKDVIKGMKAVSAIQAKYEKLGGLKGFLGSPTTEELHCPDGVGYFRHYQNGSIYRHPKTGVYEVHGMIRSKWESLGWEKSFLGYPVTDEMETPDKKGRYNHFQGGSIYWTPDTGAQEVHGAIRDKWASLGWEKSYLGFPTTDECTTPDTIGRYNHFQMGSIYWTPDTGAQAVHKFVRDKWASLGWEQSNLGYPLKDSTIMRALTFSNDFQGGFITADARGSQVGTPYKQVNFKIESIHCDEETGSDWSGSDNMIISGVGTDEYMNSYPAGTISQKCDSGDNLWLDRDLMSFPLDKPGWPKVFLATTLLAEDEGSTGLGELSGIQKTIVDWIQSEVTKTLTKLGVSGTGALVGASLGSIGGLIGAAVGALVGYLVGEFFEWIIGMFNDQWFTPAVSSLILPSVHTLMEPFQIFYFTRPGGKYHIVAGWKLINP